jgi:hypothetical protein
VELLLCGVLNGQQDVQGEQSAIEMSLHAVDVSVGEVLAVEIYLQSFDSPFYAGPFLVAGAVLGGVLGMVPVDLWEIVAIDPDESAVAFAETGPSQRAAFTNWPVLVVIWCDPDVAFAGDVTSSQLKAKVPFTDWHEVGGKAIDAVVAFG